MRDDVKGFGHFISGLFIAPLYGAMMSTIGTILVVIIYGSSPELSGNLVVIPIIAVVLSLIGAIIIGLPSLLVLRWFNLLHPPAVLITSVLAGIAFGPSCLYLLLGEDINRFGFSLSELLTAAVIGGFGGFGVGVAFWRSGFADFYVRKETDAARGN